MAAGCQVIGHPWYPWSWWKWYWVLKSRVCSRSANVTQRVTKTPCIPYKRWSVAHQIIAMFCVYQAGNTCEVVHILFAEPLCTWLDCRHLSKWIWQQCDSNRWQDLLHKVTPEPSQHRQNVCDGISTVEEVLTQALRFIQHRNPGIPVCWTLIRALTFTPGVLCLACSDLLLIYKMIQYLATAFKS